MSSARLIVGLGNPGKDYEYTRHNFGFLVIQNLAARYRLKFTSSSFSKALAAAGQIEGIDAILLQPLTFVNLSGVAVKSTIAQKQIDLENVLIVCDDLDTEFGQLRLRAKGSDGGHNGLTSIIQQLGSAEFARLRCGIGRPKSSAETVDFVLGEFTRQEKESLQGIMDEATDCCLSWLKDGTKKAMDQFNRRKENGKNSTDA